MIDGPDEDDAVAAGSCAPDHVFHRDGIAVEVGGLGQHRTARLLPDDFTGHLEDGWEIVGPNLAAPSEP